MNKKNILIVLPKSGFNEQEFIITKTILERGGAIVFIASSGGSLCVGENKLKVKADINFYNIHESNFEGIVFIGGSGVNEYLNDKNLNLIVQRFNAKSKIVAAICAAPLILAGAGILTNKKATCFSPLENELKKAGTEYVDAQIVVFENIITAKDFNAAEEFAYAVYQKL